MKKFYSKIGFPINVYNDKEFSSVDYKHIVSALNLPQITSKDLAPLFGKMVETGGNKNMAWFDTSELIKPDTFNSIDYKALTDNHEEQSVVGFILAHKYVDKSNNKILEYADIEKLNGNRLKNLNLDIIIGGFLFSDRFVELASEASIPTKALSMECYYENFLLKLDDLLLSQEEAAALGLSHFMDRIMDNFSSMEECLKAHSLKVIAGNGTEGDILVYKYLTGILFNGCGLVSSPACPSCTIIPNESMVADELKMAASQIVPEFSLDLRKIDRYMKAYQLDNKITTNCRCKEMQEEPKDNADLKEVADPGVPPSMNPPFAGDTPPDSTQTYTPSPQANPDVRPGFCVQFRNHVYKLEKDGSSVQEDLIQLDSWCLRNDVKCEVGGDASQKGCVRWAQNDEGDLVWDGDDNYQAIEVDGVTYFDKAEVDTLIEDYKKKFKRASLNKFEALIHNHKAFLASIEPDSEE